MTLINIANTYDAYISYSREDAGWVQDILLPKLISSGARIAISGTVRVPGVIHVIDREQSIVQARWIIAVLSPSYLAEQTAASELLFAAGIAIENDSNRLVPIYIAQVDQQLPTFLHFIKGYDLTNSKVFDHNMHLLVQVLKGHPGPIGVAEHEKKPNVSISTTEAALQYDIFVSYSQIDQNWVQSTLLPQLEAAGLWVCMDFRDFIPSISGLSETVRAVQSSYYILLVITNDYLKRDWNQLEQILQRDLDSNESRLILLVQAGLRLPSQLNHRTIIYFETPERRNRTWNRVIQVLSSDSSNNISTDYAYDVYVTCADADREWMQNEILPQLETSKLRVYIDRQNLETDTPTMLETEQALRVSRNTLLLLTRSYLQEKWPAFDSVLLRLPIHQEGRLIPLVDAGCSVPMRISQITAAYFVRDMQQMWQQLLKELLARP